MRGDYTWSDANPITIDASRQYHHHFSIRYNAVEQLKTPNERKAIDYFHIMNAINFDRVVDAINDSLTLDFTLEGSSRHAVTKGEMIKFFGIRLAMVLNHRQGSILDYWAVEQKPGTIFEPLNYGKKYGMTRNRFMAIHKHFVLDYPQNADQVSIKMMYYNILNLHYYFE